MSHLLDLIQTSTVVAALVAAAVALTVNTLQRRREARSGRRDVFAAAYAAYAAYREMPYVVRRRGLSDPEAERRRISEMMREIQERISYHLAWTRLHAPRVGTAYGDLVAELRRVAGRAVAAEWLRPPITEDAQMNVPDIDLVELDTAADEYLAAVEQHLHPLRTVLRRVVNRWEWMGRREHRMYAEAGTDSRAALRSRGARRSLR